MAYDVQSIRDAHRVSEIAARYVKLTRNGPEFTGLCPFHSEKSPSFTINDAKGFYHCFGCGAQGDVIAFVKNIHNVGFKDACAILGGESVAPAALPPAKERKESKGIYEGLAAIPLPEAEIPAPGELLHCWNPKSERQTTYKPSMVFPYRAPSGECLGVVIRIDTAPGKKITPTLRKVIMPDGREVLSHMPFDTPRPWYGAEKITAATTQVLIVEGEKSADAANRIFGGSILALSWSGGAAGAKHADWPAISGLSVVLWPDADESGWKGMQEAAALAHGAGVASIKLIEWDRSKPKKWDAANAEAEGWDKAAVVEWLKDHAKMWEFKPEPGNVPLPEPEPGQQMQEYEPAPPPVEDDDDLPPFTILGHDRGVYYYFPRGAEQVRALTPQAHNESNLNDLAPIQYWERKFEKGKGVSGKFDVSAARNALIHRAQAVGIFNMLRLRGRGAWVDGGRAMVHTGDTVYVDGKPFKPGQVPSRYIYEAGSPLELKLAAPLANKDAEKLPLLLERLTWEQPLSGQLLAGWLVIAPVCGILPWRPHVWLCGAPSAGKSTVMNLIVKPLVSFFAEDADGNSTEPGIRRALGADARPVVIDEAESEDRNAADNIKRILSFMRIASSGGVIKKANMHGGTDTHTVRTSILLSSVNVSVSEDADARRITKLVLRKNENADKKEHYDALRADLIETITPEYASRLFARTIANMGSLLKNIATFSSAAASVLSNQAAGDQVGPMIAGLYLCKRTDEISYENAVKWIKERNWFDFAHLEGSTDESRLISKIMTSTRRISDGGQGQKDYSVGELVVYVATTEYVDANMTKDAIRELGRIGIRVLRPKTEYNPESEPYFLVANQSPDLEKILYGTPWAKNWKLVLQRIGGEGSATKKQMHFSDGLQRRATRLPVSLLTEE